MQYDIFISYSSIDKKITERVCSYLEQHGIRCFVAYRDIPRGVVWASAIVEALEHSRMLLVLFSKHFNNSRQVDREIELAAEQGMPILTLRLDDEEFAGVKKYYLKNLNWIDAYPNPERSFDSLIKNVLLLLGDKCSLESVTQSSPHPASNLMPMRHSLKRWLWLVGACMIVVLIVVSGLNSGNDDTGEISNIAVVSREDRLTVDTVNQNTKQFLEKVSQQQSQSYQTISKKSENIAPLYVTTIPLDVTVYVDGEKVGTTPIEGKEIACGSHEVRLSKEGYQDTIFIRVFGEKPVILNEILVKVPESESVAFTVVATGKINGHEYVDLGLSVKWAACNIGASSPSDYGDYYAWGETSTKSTYNHYNSKTWEVAIGSSIAGHVSTDVAHCLWGRKWRLPTSDELQELADKCTWVWTSVDGHNGYRITGPNGQSIFLPAAGWYDKTSVYHAGEQGHYWSATPNGRNAQLAVGLAFTHGSKPSIYGYKRYRGRPIRPVVK